MFESALDILNRQSAKRGSGGIKSSTVSDNGVFFSTSNTAAPGKYPFLLFRIGREVARKAGLALGDTVLFGRDKETGVGKIYADKKGWKLVSGNVKSDNPPLILRVTWQEGLPSIANGAMCTEIIARSREISFRYPEGTSFNGLARKKEESEEDPMDEMYEEHRKLVETINKKAAKPAEPKQESEAPMMKDGLPYGRRKGDKKPRKD